MIDKIRTELANNNNKISKEFLDSLIEEGTVTYTRLTPTMHICVIV